MIMKRHIALLLLIATAFVACTDFLKEENKTQYSQDYIFNSEKGLELAVAALYTPPCTLYYNSMNIIKFQEK